MYRQITTRPDAAESLHRDGVKIRPLGLRMGRVRLRGCRRLAAGRILDQGLLQRLVAFNRREHKQSCTHVKLFIRIQPRADLSGQDTADSIHTLPGHPTNIVW